MGEPHKQLRLLLLGESLGHGGADRAMTNLAIGLRRRGHEVAVVTLHGPETLRRDLADADVPFTNFGLASGRDVLAGLTAVRRLLRTMRPNVVHAHLRIPSMYAATVRGLSGRPPVIVTYHNLTYDAHPRRSYAGRAKKAVYGYLMRAFVSAHIAVSEPVRSHYMAHLALSSTMVIPNGFTIEALPRMAEHGATAWERRARADRCGPLVVCPATFRHEKNHDLLLRSFAALLSEQPDATLFLVGDGPLRGAIETQIAELGLTEAVVLTGILPHCEVLAAMAASDAVVLASSHEGLPVTAVEAIGLGCTIVTTAVGGLPDIMEPYPGGWLVKNPDVKELSDALRSAVDHPTHSSADLKMIGAAQMRDYCDLDQVVEHHLRVYRRTLGHAS